MSETFFISDTHFSHNNLISAEKYGYSMRPEFSCIEEMDECMVANWNRVVTNKDIVYHLGDITMNKRYLGFLDRLQGIKYLVMGNHDTFGYARYQMHFANVYHLRPLPGEKILMTHIPVHEQSIKAEWVNVHGHIHDQVICKDGVMRTKASMNEVGGEKHPRYSNVCVEQINYTPISIDVIREAVSKL